MGKDATQTTTQRLDPASQGFVDFLRYTGRQGAQTALGQPGSFFAGADPRSIQEQIAPFMDPFTQQVIGGVRGEFDILRDQAGRGASQAATSAGAFGGSRHGVEAAIRKAELDRAQGQTVSGLLSDQFNQALGQGLQYSEYQRALRERQLQEPLFRQQAAQGFLGSALGPVGQTTTQRTPRSLFQDVAGLGLVGLGAFGGGGPGLMAAGGAGGGAAGGVPGVGGSIFNPNWVPPQFGTPGFLGRF